MREYICGTDGHEGHWFTGEDIVRCRDCEFFESDDIADGCTQFDFSIEYMEQGFCAWASRKEVDA